jgi:hypothetical protein
VCLLCSQFTETCSRKVDMIRIPMFSWLLLIRLLSPYCVFIKLAFILRWDWFTTVIIQNYLPLDIFFLFKICFLTGRKLYSVESSIVYHPCPIAWQCLKSRCLYLKLMLAAYLPPSLLHHLPTTDTWESFIYLLQYFITLSSDSYRCCHLKANKTLNEFQLAWSCDWNFSLFD